MESYSVQLCKVYKITVIEQTATDAMWDRIPMVKVNGKYIMIQGEEALSVGVVAIWMGK